MSTWDTQTRSAIMFGLYLPLARTTTTEILTSISVSLLLPSLCRVPVPAVRLWVARPPSSVGSSKTQEESIAGCNVSNLVLPAVDQRYGAAGDASKYGRGAGNVQPQLRQERTGRKQQEAGARRGFPSSGDCLSDGLQAQVQPGAAWCRCRAGAMQRLELQVQLQEGATQTCRRERSNATGSYVALHLLLPLSCPSLSFSPLRLSSHLAKREPSNLQATSSASPSSLSPRV